MVCDWYLTREGRGGQAIISCGGLSSSGAKEQTRGKGQGQQQEQEMELELELEKKLDDNDDVRGRRLCTLPAM